MSASVELTAVARTLQATKKVVVACHEAPDGDALGSLIGCGTALRRGGWDTVLWAPGDTPLPADYAWLGYDDVVRMPPADLSERLLLALDCGSAARLGVDGPAALTTADATINVDHHSDVGTRAGCCRSDRAARGSNCCGTRGGGCRRGNC